MGFSIEVPLPGASFSTEGVKVGNALATITSWANGGIVGSDLSPSANIQPSQLAGGVTLPTGAILPFGGSAAPAGYLVCNGGSQLRASYPLLFSVIGLTYGLGSDVSGSSTFALPDLRGRAPIGSGTGTGLTARALGVKGGEENHALTGPEGPSHNHTLTDSLGPTNIYTLTATAAAGGSGRFQVAPWTTGFTELVTGPNGNGNAHNTMSPYQVINFLIKT